MLLFYLRVVFEIGFCCCMLFFPTVGLWFYVGVIVFSCRVGGFRETLVCLILMSVPRVFLVVHVVGCNNGVFVL